MGKTKAVMKGGVQRYYDGTTLETISVEAPVYFYDDFVCKAADLTNIYTVQATNAGSFLVNAQSGGACRLTTGATDTNDLQVALSVRYHSSKGLGIEARLCIADVAHSDIFVGFAEAAATAAGTLPITFATTTLTTTAVNAVGLIASGGATSNVVRGVSVNANVDGTTVVSTVTPADAAFHIYRVELDTARTAYFWLDGQLLGTQLLAVAAATLLTPKVDLRTTGESAANTADLDYLRVWQLER